VRAERLRCAFLRGTIPCVGLLFAAAIVLLSSFATPAAALTYYVDATRGDDWAAGTSESEPWQTLGKVSGSSFAPGDQILFKRGEKWSGPDEVLTIPSSGSSGTPIVFGAYGTGAAPVIDAAGSSPYCVSGASKSYITVQDLECRGWTDAGIQSSGGGGWTIRGCTLQDGGDDAAPDYGIRVQSEEIGPPLNEVIISDNRIGRINQRENDELGSAGISVQGLVGAIIARNDVSTRNMPGITSTDTVRITLERNRIAGCYGDHLAITGTDGADIRYNTVRNGTGAGITLSSGSDQALLAYNLIHGIASPTRRASNGINVSGGSLDGKAYNNVVYRVHGNSFHLDHSDGWELRNNILDASANTGAMIPFVIREASYTADRNLLHPRQEDGPNRMPPGTSATQLAATNFGVQTLQYPVTLTPGAPYLFRFQAFSDGSGRARVAIQHGGEFLQDDGSWSNTPNWDLTPLDVRRADADWKTKKLTLVTHSGTDYTIRFENIRNAGDVYLDKLEIFMQAGIVVDSNGKARSLAAHQKRDGQNVASLDGRPLFVDPANGDFRLQQASPAISAGETVGLPLDFGGLSVPASPAIGAYERVPESQGETDP
jgi:hypothetical protein